MQWRHDFQGIGVDNITEDMIGSELKSGKSFWYKFDKKRQAIVYIRPRCHDPSGTDAAEVCIPTMFSSDLAGIDHGGVREVDGTICGVEHRVGGEASPAGGGNGVGCV